MALMDVPCRAVVWYLLPALGAELAKEMKEDGMTQNEIAEKLGVTPSAVSQYLKKKRGSEIKFGTKSAKMVKQLAKSLKNGTGCISSVCNVCRTARSERVLCKIHEKQIGSCGCKECKRGCVC